LENIKLKTTKTIDVKEFIDVIELDPILIERTYYVERHVKVIFYST